MPVVSYVKAVLLTGPIQRADLVFAYVTDKKDISIERKRDI